MDVQVTGCVHVRPYGCVGVSLAAECIASRTRTRGTSYPRFPRKPIFPRVEARTLERLKKRLTNLTKARIGRVLKLGAWPLHNEKGN